MEIKDRTIALLIDSDNVSSDYFSILLDELSQYGKVTYRRLYGDLPTRGRTAGRMRSWSIPSSRFSRWRSQPARMRPIPK